jgi:tetratricopeptide (TPR) repeat protein
MILRNMGRFQDALVEYERFHAIAEGIGTLPARRMALVRLGTLALELGDYERGEALLTEHLRLVDETGARRQGAVTTGNLGIVSWRRGRAAEARARYQVSLDNSRETGYRRGEAIARFNLAEVAMRLGDFAEARRHLELAEETTIEVGEGVLRGNVALALGRVELAEGDLGAAHARFEQSLALAREARNRASEAEAHLFLGLVAEQRGDADAARAELQEADAAAREVGERMVSLLVAAHRARLGAIPPAEAEELRREYDDALGHTERLDVQWALWQATGDASHLEQAQRLLDELRAHAPPADRDAMLERVPLYAEISAARPTDRRTS